MAARREQAGEPSAERPGGSAWLGAGVLGTGVYGGYFGAAQGVLLFALLGSALPDDLQRVNALRNLLAGTANTVASVVFVVAAHVDPLAAVLIAISSSFGGVLGARIGQRLSPTALRAVVVVVGIAAIVRVLS